MTCMTKMKRDAESLQPATSEAELTGTAAFDAGTGDMPAWGDLVAEHADGGLPLGLSPVRQSA